MRTGCMCRGRQVVRHGRWSALAQKQAGGHTSTEAGEWCRQQAVSQAQAGMQTWCHLALGPAGQ